MKLLGAVLAGGQSRRFGSDKAEALLEGRRLIDLVADALAPQCAALVVCGRVDHAFTCLPDRPGPGIGPLGGLAAALHHAASQGYDAVLSAGCDVPNLPGNLAQILSGARGDASIAESQPVIGLWPSGLTVPLDGFIADGGRALYGFAEHVGARSVVIDPPLANVNRPEDLPPA